MTISSGRPTIGTHFGLKLLGPMVGFLEPKLFPCSYAPAGVGQAVPDKNPENVRHSLTYTENQSD